MCVCCVSESCGDGGTISSMCGGCVITLLIPGCVARERWVEGGHRTWSEPDQQISSSQVGQEESHIIRVQLIINQLTRVAVNKNAEARKFNSKVFTYIQPSL